MVNSRAGSARSFAPITNTQIAAVIGAVSSQRSAQLKARIIMCRDSETGCNRPPAERCRARAAVDEVIGKHRHPVHPAVVHALGKVWTRSSLCTTVRPTSGLIANVVGWSGDRFGVLPPRQHRGLAPRP